MNESVKKILEELSGSKEFVEKLKEINEKYPDKEENARALAELAKEIGIEVSAEDILNSFNSLNTEELSEAELEQVGGGYMTRSYDSYLHKEVYSTDCACIGAGSGSSDEYQKKCVCVLGGAGELTKKGKTEFNNGDVAMWCALAGASMNIYYKK